MGISVSKSKTPGESLARKRKKELEKHGILVPPAFAIGRLPLSPSTLCRLPQQLSYYDYLRTIDPSTRILQDHMEAGLWMTADTTGIGHIRASLSDFESGGEGRVMGHIKGYVLRAGTVQVPSVATSLHVIPNILSLFGKINTSGQGWLGATFDYTYKNTRTPELHTQNIHLKPEDDEESNVHVKLGSWIPFDCKSPKDVRINQVHAYAAVDLLGSTAAVETKIPLDTLEPETKSFFTIDLRSEEAPPMQITLERENDTSAIALTQIFSIDRYQLNILEDRAPKVRNTIGWTCRMERSDSGAANVAVGAGWQVNRALAFKAKVEPQDSSITAALLVKRWKQPRVTSSILAKYDWKNQTIRFIGVGIELETGRLSQYDYYQDSEVATSHVGSDGPKTKPILPGDTEAPLPLPGYLS